jgi:hypothetical protein
MKKAQKFFTTIFKITLSGGSQIPKSRGVARSAGVGFLLALLLAIPLFAETISGYVFDTNTNNPISGVKAKISSPVCSTQTNALGYFSLNIPTTEALPRAVPAMTTKIFFNTSQNYFLLDGEKVFVDIRNIKGETVSGNDLSQGQYFAVCRSPSFSGTFKFLNIAGQYQSFVLERKINEGGKLAKAAANYSVSFSTAGYLPKSVTAVVGQSVNAYLAPLIVPRDSAQANIGISFDSAGTVHVTVVFDSSTVLIPKP